MGKVNLTEEKETLLIPLYGKAKETKKESPIIIDIKAVDIINQINYDFSSLKIPGKTNIMMSLRAKLIDNYVKEFLSTNDGSLALHLGCGLDSRFHRVGNSDVNWYDVDFKEVIDIRSLFFNETDKYHMIPSSVTEKDWIEKLPTDKNHNIVIAEGLFMYLEGEEIKKLLGRLKERIGDFTLIFDAFSVFTAKKVGKHPSVKKTGAIIKWGIDNPEELCRWGMDIEFIGQQYFTSNSEIGKLSIGTKAMFKIAGLFPFVREAQRILIYRVSQGDGPSDSLSR